MRLLVEVVGVLVLAALARAVLADERRVSLASALAVVAIAAFGYAVFSQAWSFGQALLREHAANEQAPPGASEDAGGTIFPANAAFLEWVDGQVPKDATMLLVCPQACGGGLDEWITYRLSPRRFVDRIDEADWLLFYAERAQENIPFAGAAPVKRQFEPMFAIGEVER
jgi:hypothetical protein